jgi:hypothetical protein
VHGVDAWRLLNAKGSDAVLLGELASKVIEEGEKRDERLAQRIIAELARAMK